MIPIEERYWQVIQRLVCSKCIDADCHGSCLLSKDMECAVRRFLPRIIDIVNSVSSDSIRPYETMLRMSVCQSCVHQSIDGSCSLREEVDCALDRYFPLIVQGIEEARGKDELSGPGK